MTNIDKETVDSFGEEWARFSQDRLTKAELSILFEKYFAIFPWDTLKPDAEGFDMGCGSGRWASLVASRVGLLNCVDPSPEALEVAKKNLLEHTNIVFLNAGTSDCSIKLESQDFGYSLGVLHHIPNTAQAMKDCVRLLKVGAPFLVYLYYRFDNRPRWYYWIWKLSDIVRTAIVKTQGRTKNTITDLIAVFIYLPLSFTARIGEKLGFKVDNWLLSSYRNCSFYTMRTDSRDRFGTPLEQRFTRDEVRSMMQDSGLVDISFSEHFPFWCAVGIKSS